MQFRLLSAGLHISVFTLSMLATSPGAAATPQETIQQATRAGGKAASFAAFTASPSAAPQDATPADRDDDTRARQRHAGMLMLFLQAASGKKLGGG